MSFDRLQSRIRAVKSPVAAELDLRPESLPPGLLARHTAALGQTLGAAAAAAEEAGHRLIDALADTVPAVQFPVSSFELMGWRGMETLEKLISYARDRELFVIADAQRGGLGPSAAAYGAAWLGKTRVGDALLPVFDADCVTLNGYLGSDCLKPVLEACAAQDKCALVLVKMPRPSSAELEDLAAGDRQVCTAVGDLARRVAGDTAGGKYRFSPLGVVVGTPYPAEMKQLRRRWEQTFFLVPCCDAPEAMNTARYAFDKYGWGAAVCVRRPILDAFLEGADSVHAAALELGRQWRECVTLL